MIYKCYAKINYMLQVMPKSKEDLHQLCSIATKISLYDEIEVKKNKTHKIVVSCDDEAVPSGEGNLVYKVLEAFNKYNNKKQGYTVSIKKNIPVSAGLGGGSSDAAGALLAAMELGDVHYGEAQLIEIVKGLGSDIPQFFVPGTVLIEGYGERITPIDDNLEVFIVLVKPKKGVSSKEAYMAFDKYGHTSDKEDTLLNDLKNDTFQDAYTKMKNDLEDPVMDLKPELKTIKNKMQSLGLPFVLMSGSGSCFFGLTRNEQIAEKVQKHFSNKGFFSKVVTKV